MNDKILIFIPMYRCEKQIVRVLARIAELGEKQKLFAGVLVVDNGSPDASISAAAEAQFIAHSAKVSANENAAVLIGAPKRITIDRNR